MVEIIFLMLVLKLPILYLIGVVWWAVRAEPRPPEPAVVNVTTGGDPPAPRRQLPKRPRRGGPHGRRAERRAGRLPLR